MIINENYFKENNILIAGVDEVGRGAIAGPVIASAVILPPNIKIDQLKDSKKLTDKKRRILLDIIKKEAIEYSIGLVSIEEIDLLNIHNASFLAMKKAIENLITKPNYVLVDGYSIPKLKINNNGFINGDNRFLAISAASIYAKVFRDDLMVNLSKKYENYNFEINKGYGTRNHIENIIKYHPCEIHRKSFNPVKKYL